MLVEQLLEEGPPFLELAFVGVGVRGEDVLPERGLEYDPRFVSAVSGQPDTAG